MRPTQNWPVFHLVSCPRELGNGATVQRLARAQNIPRCQVRRQHYRLCRRHASTHNTECSKYEKKKKSNMRENTVFFSVMIKKYIVSLSHKLEHYRKEKIPESCSLFLSHPHIQISLIKIPCCPSLSSFYKRDLYISSKMTC